MKVVICSSIVNEEAVERLADTFASYYPGSTIIIPFSVPYHRTHNPLEKSVNRKYYFDNIKEADEVIVFTDKHIGVGTALEIGYALALSKKLCFSHKPPDGQKWDEIRGLLADGSAHLLSERVGF